MPHVANRWFCDTPHSGGVLWVPAGLLQTDSANLVLTRNALGDWSLNRTAGGAETYNIKASLPGLRRLLEAIDLQEQYGGSPGPQSYPGKPPFSNAGAPVPPAWLTPPSASVAKGLQVDDVFFCYQVGVADLTSATPSLNKIGFADNVANAITNIPIAATALPLTAAGDAVGPYLRRLAVTTPTMLVDDASDLELELQLVLQNNGTIRVYGLGFHCHFNYD